MAGSLRVLFIEDSSDDAGLQVRLLEQAGYAVEFLRVETPSELGSAIEQNWDLIISDYSMPHFTGLDALRMVRESGSEVPFLFVSGTIGEETAVKALKSGAQDYLIKGRLNRLVASVERELREAEERRIRWRLEQEVHQLQRFEAVGRLAGGVAHDFNNVVGAIMGWAEIGLEEAKENSRAKEKFFKIRAQAEKAAARTRQLLAYAQRQVLQPCNTDLNGMIREQLPLLRSIIGAQIGLVTRLCPEDCVAWADRSQVEQIVMNLCLNARDAMPRGGTLIIETTNLAVGESSERVRPSALPGRYAVLRISDTGAGIGKGILEQIFEPFFTTKDVGNGTGLGLAAVYGMVKQHKGFIDVRSEVAHGTTFHVFLPGGSGKPAPATSIQTS